MRKKINKRRSQTTVAQVDMSAGTDAVIICFEKCSSCIRKGGIMEYVCNTEKKEKNTEGENEENCKN